MKERYITEYKYLNNMHKDLGEREGRRMNDVKEKGMSEMCGGTLIAPPVNLRVRVVASIAITGVEVAKTT